MKRRTNTKTASHTAKKPLTFLTYSVIASLLLLSCTFSAGVLHAQQNQSLASASKRLDGIVHSHFQAEDIFELEYAVDPQVSPNGNEMVYVRRSNDIMTDSTRSSLWIVDIKGESHRPIVSSQKNHYSPRWSPDGKRLAFVSNSEGRPQLYVRWMDTGQTALITNVEASPSSIAWAPNGKTIAFTMNVESDEIPFNVNMPAKPKGAEWSEPFEYITKARYQADGQGILDPAFTQIFVVPAEGGTARQLSSGNYHHTGSLSWGADSQHIYFSANRSDNWEYEPGEATNKNN